MTILESSLAAWIAKRREQITATSTGVIDLIREGALASLSALERDFLADYDPNAPVLSKAEKDRQNRAATCRAALASGGAGSPTGKHYFEIAVELQRTMGGLTDDELKHALERRNILPTEGITFAKRRGELAAAGLVAYAGEMRTSDMGNPAKVWDLTEEGLALVNAGRRAKGVEQS